MTDYAVRSSQQSTSERYELRFDAQVDAAPTSSRHEVYPLAGRKDAKWLTAAHDALLDSLMLERDWDSFGAHPVGVEAARAAKVMLELAFHEGVQVAPEIKANTEGSIEICWRGRSWDLEFEYGAEGQGSVLIWYGDERHWEGELADTPVAVPELLAGL